MLEYSGSSAASAVIMSHELRQKKIIFVEGCQEGLLLECIFDGQIKAMPANGYLGVTEATDTVIKYNLVNKSKTIAYIGFIDRDYLALKDSKGLLERFDIITTTNRDIEIDILKSKAAKRFLEEKATASKWKCEKKVVNEIFNNLQKLSHLRAYNHVYEKKWDFKWIDLTKYSDNEGILNYEKLTSTFCQKNHIVKSEWTAFESWIPEQEICLESITRGHDATCLLGKMLRKKLGNRKKDETSQTTVEENLRLAVEVKFISLYQWFLDIFKWTYNNAFNANPRARAFS